ncbi:efflux RND transporter permease subunit [Sediminispirochaeta bajacaliforniensis]|uniref:efflux RND transporter permease subunit n=1 Tax=Sediminispirochaeta bajacaliforniensis TaxID=148 RepID=UPI000367D766|nr:efflux RND transporter permease subunit [Sediminispirochaeta bajacaliforniensis]
MNITELSVRRPVTILVVTALLVGLSLFMVPDLAVEMFPSADYPVIMVRTTYTGASPEEVEDGVTSVLEKQLSNVSGIESITSTSMEGSSLIRLKFDYSTDLDDATNDIRDSLERVTSALPDDAGSPQILKFDSSSMPIMLLMVSGEESSDVLTQLAEDTIQPRLERIKGVASADVRGGETKEVKVDLSLNRMAAYGISFSTVESALKAQDVLLSGGDFEKGGMSYNLRINERFGSLDDIRRTVVASIDTNNSSGSVNRSNVVRLEDIADVYLDEKDSDTRVYVNGSPSVSMVIRNETNTNTVQIANAVREALPEINKSLPPEVKVDILYNTTTMISTLLNQVYISALQGAALAMLILFVFLRNIKSTLIIGISIPISLLITLGAMFFFKLTLNMISLTGLILGLGMIVDSSIVILENIYKYRERGAKLHAAAILGSREMVTAIVASTLTTLCVFIPMIIWKDDLEMLGQMFQDMIFTIVISLLSSLAVALMVVPALSSTYLKVYSRKQKPLKNPLLRKLDTISEKGFTAFEDGYASALRFALRNRALVLTLVIVLFLLSLAQLSTMGLQFQPNSDSDDEVTIDLTMPVGTALDSTEAVLMEMRKTIEKEIKGYENIIITVESGEGSIEIMLPDLEDQIDNPTTIKKKLRPYLNEIPNASFKFPSGRGFGGTSDPVDIEVISSDLTLAGETASKIRDLIRDLPQIVDPLSSLENGAPEYRIVIDKDRAAALGLTVSDVASAVSDLVDGDAPVTYWLNGDELDVLVRLKEEDRNSETVLSSLSVISSSKEAIPLSNIASFELTAGPEDIDREDEKRVVHVTSDITSDTTATEVNAMLQEYLSTSFVVPDGVTLSFSGEAEDISRMGGPLVIVMVIAIIMVFAVMASLFESLVDPFIIFFSIPMLLIGVVFVYTLLGQPLSLFSIVGMVVLVGIVVNNGIVLVDYTNLLRHKDVPLMEAVQTGARSRLRPVLMTSLTTILGMVPMGFFGSEGTESIQAIGQTIVGGLVASTFLTLFVTPVVYSLINRDRKWFRKKKKEEGNK